MTMLLCLDKPLGRSEDRGPRKTCFMGQGHGPSRTNGTAKGVLQLLTTRIAKNGTKSVALPDFLGAMSRWHRV